MEEERLSIREAADAVLRDNLYGLEIDERCTQIAAFALALAAWTLPGASGFRALPEMHIACCGVAPMATRTEWLSLAGEDRRLRAGMEELYVAFQSAPILGSLVDPSSCDRDGRQVRLGAARFEELQPLLVEKPQMETSEAAFREREIGVAASGMVAAASILGGRYHLVATNVPYLSGRRQAPALFQFIADRYPDSTSDLSAACMERIWSMLETGGTAALVTPQTWLFTSSYEALRRKALAGLSWLMLAKLGTGAFETISGEVVNVALTIIANTAPDTSRHLFVLDVTDECSVEAKAVALRSAGLKAISQESQRANPGARITGDALSSSSLLQQYVDAPQGVKTGDDARWRKYHWEIPSLANGWERYQSTVTETQFCGGRELVIDWRSGGVGMIRLRIDNVAVGRLGVAVSQTGDLPCTLYHGHRYDSNVAAIVPKNPAHVASLWAFCSSADYREAVREIDQSLKVSNVPLTQVQFDVKHWTRIAAAKFPDGLPEPLSGDPTQWTFRGSISHSSAPLQVAVARLLGYRWPDQQPDEIDELADDDGIVCIPSVRGEQAAAVRLVDVLGRAYGDEWSAKKQAELLHAVGCGGWTLDRWLRDRFFSQHCGVFQHFPFVWHIWDGLKKDGFSALVNYHRLDAKLLERLAHTYLGDWIRRQRDGAKHDEDGCEERLDAAIALQDKLTQILEGEPPCDIFVRWKPLSEQPVGWNPDFNDGVRINIRPFMLVGDVGKEGAGILRDRPRIDWSSGRGKDPSDAPWYPVFKGERVNDHHLSVAEKRAAARGTRQRGAK
jgi:hypothetical protein